MKDAIRQSLWIVAVFLLLYGTALHCAQAAKIRVTWVAPARNSDGTPLIDLAGYRIEWGSCLADGITFGTYQAGINVPATATSAWIYPTGINQVCARLYAINSKQVLSLPAYGSGPAPVKLPRPTH